MSSNPRDDLLEVASADGTVVVTMRTDRLDDSTSHALSGRLLALIEHSNEREIRMDLGGLEFISSTGLGLFVTLHKKLKGEGRHLALLDANPDVYEVFEVTHLHHLLDVRPKAAD